MQFQLDQSEEYYRKLLLLDKILTELSNDEKQYIFNKGYCWDILFKDNHLPFFAVDYLLGMKMGKIKVTYNKKMRLKLEKHVLTNPNASIMYAKDVLNERWPEAEPMILKNLNSALDYYEDVILIYDHIEEWVELEESLLSDPYNNAKNIIEYSLLSNKRFVDVEKYIFQEPCLSVLYIREIIKSRCPEAEKIILTDIDATYYYAVDVLKDCWPEAEAILINSTYKDDYLKFVEKIGKVNEY